VSGYVEITDPLAANGQTGIALGAATTLAYSHHAGANGIPAPIDGAHAAVIALFGNHMAASVQARVSHKLPPLRAALGGARACAPDMAIGRALKYRH